MFVPPIEKCMNVRVEPGDEGIFTVVMDRPEKRNAFTLDMYQAFGDALEALQADDEVRCVVVRGASGAFCAGSDIAGFDSGRSGREQAREYADFTVAMTDRLRDLRHPTIACIEGVCVGGGLEIASMCDIRIAGASARFGIPVNRIGLTLDHHELADLMTVVGPVATLEILLEGRIFGATEALAKGLVTRIVGDDELANEVRTTALAIARSAPLVNRWHKKFVRRLLDKKKLESAEIDEAYQCFDTQDYRIGLDAFNAKQRPLFQGR